MPMATDAKQFGDDGALKPVQDLYKKVNHKICGVGIGVLVQQKQQKPDTVFLVLSSRSTTWYTHLVHASLVTGIRIAVPAVIDQLHRHFLPQVDSPQHAAGGAPLSQGLVPSQGAQCLDGEQWDVDKPWHLSAAA